MRVAFALAVVLLAGSPAQADGGKPARVNVFSQALLYGTALAVEESDFNPGNALAHIPAHQLDGELRVDLAAAAGDCNASAKLRARYARAGHDESHAGFVNQGGLRCRLGGGAFELSAGREVLQWGSSFYLSPSNPFFTDTGKTNPIQELAGKDMLQALWFADHGVTVSLIRNPSRTAREPDPLNFSPLSALRVDVVGDAASGGAIVSRRDDGIERLGLYGTLPWSRALVLYAEANAGRGSAGWFPAGAALAQTKLDSKQLLHTVLAGGGYTFESGWTLNAEWIHGNEGYSANERREVKRLVSAAARDFPQPQATGLIGSALAPNLPYLGTDYLFLQLLRTEWEDKGDVALRWTRSFGTGGGTLLSGSFTWYLDNHCQLFLLASRSSGAAGRDVGRLIRSSVQAGVRFTF